MTNTIDIHSAIDLLKSGGNLDDIIISDLTTSKVGVMDALLLAENGCLVPDGNIVYNDKQVLYDPDFDDVEWGKAIPFKKLKQTLFSEEEETKQIESAELIVKLHISTDMRQWLAQNREHINIVIGGLLESMYKADIQTKP